MSNMDEKPFHVDSMRVSCTVGRKRVLRTGGGVDPKHNKVIPHPLLSEEGGLAWNSRAHPATLPVPPSS